MNTGERFGVKITGIINETTFQVEMPWNWHGLEGDRIRLISLNPLPSHVLDQKIEIEKMKNLLVGRILVINMPYFVETGPTLVANVEIDGIVLKEVFKRRYTSPPSKTLEYIVDENRKIRPVEGWVGKKWSNPLRFLDGEENYPFLHANIEYPTVPEYDSYRKRIEDIENLYCDSRTRFREDDKRVKAFLKYNNRRLLTLFGECGSGKSWFIRHYLRCHPPANTDIVIIDVLNLPLGDDFRKAFHNEVSKSLTACLSKYEGGLLEFCRLELELEARTIFPGLSYDNKKVVEWCEEVIVKKSLSDDRVEYNRFRLSGYAYHKQNILFFIDNLDHLQEDNQNELFEFVLRSLIQQSGIRLIISLRPSTSFYALRRSAELQHLNQNHTLSPLIMSEMISKRLFLNHEGDNISKKEVYDASNDTTWKIEDIFNRFIGSESEKIVTDLAGGDARHYIRLFRRLLLSDELIGFDQIGNSYKCITSLMFKHGETFKEEISYILNMFDNGFELEVGNALIRWRVLEFFLGRGKARLDFFFEYYFKRMGYDMRRVNDVMNLLEAAGLLLRYKIGIGKDEELDEASITPTANRYEQLIRSLWYCITVKTSMNIDTKYIKPSAEAARFTRDYSIRIPIGAEWVSDEDFLSFILDEEVLEEKRIASYPYKVEQFETRLKESGPKSIHYELWFEYMYQKRDWLRRKQKREGRS
jgi:hypothetical protein